MYFSDRFGRNDFEKIAHRSRLGDAMAYILKYIEKSGERIVYSKGLPQFFISDIMDEDVICTIGMEDQKLLLFDDFSCWDEGCYMGKVSPEVIAQMRPSDWNSLNVILGLKMKILSRRKKAKDRQAV